MPVSTPGTVGLDLREWTLNTVAGARSSIRLLALCIYLLHTAHNQPWVVATYSVRFAATGDE